MRLGTIGGRKKSPFVWALEGTVCTSRIPGCRGMRAKLGSLFSSHPFFSGGSHICSKIEINIGMTRANAAPEYVIMPMIAADGSVLIPSSLACTKKPAIQSAQSSKQLKIAFRKYANRSGSLFRLRSLRPTAVDPIVISTETAVVRKPAQIAAAERTAAKNSFAM